MQSPPTIRCPQPTSSVSSGMGIPTTPQHQQEEDYAVPVRPRPSSKMVFMISELILNLSPFSLQSAYCDAPTATASIGLPTAGGSSASPAYGLLCRHTCAGRPPPEGLGVAAVDRIKRHADAHRKAILAAQPSSPVSTRHCEAARSARLPFPRSSWGGRSRTRPRPCAPGSPTPGRLRATRWQRAEELRFPSDDRSDRSPV